MRVTVSNYVSSEGLHQICSPNSMYVPSDVLYQCFKQNCEMVEILASMLWAFLTFTAVFLKTAGPREKRAEN